MQIILETPRFYLREFTATDAPLLLALNKDPQVLKYVHEKASFLERLVCMNSKWEMDFHLVILASPSYPSPREEGRCC